ncbi:MAG: DMT family transporter [Hyphomicrobiaceae bacterium]
MQLRPIDILMGISVPLIWGMGFVFAKAAINHFPPIFLMSLRFALTALVLVWFVKPPWRIMGPIIEISLVSAAIQYSMTFNGLAGLDASTAVLVVQLEVPFLVLLGAIFLGERPGIQKAIGIAIAFAGVAFIAGEPRISGAWLYLLLCAGGAFTWALGQVMIRNMSQRTGEDIGGFTLIAWVAVFAAPQLFAFSLVLEDNHIEYIRTANWIVWGTVVYLGLIMTALGYGIWYTLVARHPVSRIGPFLLLLPVFSVLASVLVLGETLTIWSVAGGGLVMTGLAVIMIERSSIDQPATDPA